MQKYIPINQAFKNVDDSYEVIAKIKHCRDIGIEAVYIDRYTSMTLKKFMFVVVRLAQYGYNLTETKKLISSGDYKELI